MQRVIACMILLGLFADASAATARDADSETPPRKIANEPASKSVDLAKPEAREDEKDAVKSELRDLRDLVQAQSEELQDLRKRVAAVEAAGVASKEVRAPADTSPDGIIQTPASTAMSAISMPPIAAAQGPAAARTNLNHRCRSKLVRRNSLQAVLVISPLFFAARMWAAG